MLQKTIWTHFFVFGTLGSLFFCCGRTIDVDKSMPIEYIYMYKQ